MALTSQDVRDIRFGTTRVRAGYDMAEVDSFLDVIESAIEAYATESRQLRDEADALRSQIQQVQSRLSSLQTELDECRALQSDQHVSDAASSHETIVTPIERDSDTEITAENPVVGSSSDIGITALRKVRDDVQVMLREQLRLVENLRIETD